MKKWMQGKMTDVRSIYMLISCSADIDLIFSSSDIKFDTSVKYSGSALLIPVSLGPFRQVGIEMCLVLPSSGLEQKGRRFRAGVFDK